MSIPVEHFDSEHRTRVAQGERRLVTVLLWCLPLLTIILPPLLQQYGLTILFLKPPADLNLLAAYRSPKAILMLGAIAALLIAWRLSIREQSSSRKMPWALFLSAGILLGMGAALSHPRVAWFFVEWAKLRTENPSFARNTLFWEQGTFDASKPASKDAAKVLLVGSSQQFQANDLTILAEQAPQFQFEKTCMAGLGPMQYPFVFNRLEHRSPDFIVGWLSEFDLYRESEIPVNRIRWTSNPDGLQTLARNLSWSQRWFQRGELADLGFASICPLWRLRDHFQRTMFGYWWKRSIAKQGDSTEEGAPEPRLADSAGLKTALGFLKKNVSETSFVDVNFRCVSDFAERCHAAGITLIIVEGQSHPLAQTAYDSSFRIRTRQRLEAMSQQHHFVYIPEADLPQMTADQFGDAYHLNEAGRDIWSQFLASQITEWSQAATRIQNKSTY